jgi:hypothetical protein
MNFSMLQKQFTGVIYKDFSKISPNRSQGHARRLLFEELKLGREPP